MVLLGLGCAGARDDAPPPPPPPSPDRVARLDELSALWSFYQFRYVEDGRVVSLDEDRITTSEGQGYGMLRAVWSDDRETFDRVWDWTKRNLQVRDDRLFAWKWKGRVLDVHSATDADSDIALALLLAARLFEEPAYETEALEVIRDIWRLEILDAGGRYFPVAGDWALREKMPTLHVAYLAPYAYAEFAKVDDGHPWARVIETSYDVLRWLFVDRELLFPPEIVYVARESGELHLESPRDRRIAEFGYDAFPIYWRVAADERWHGRWQGELRAKMLAPLRAAYDESGSLYDRYTLRGQARSKLEALPLYATAHSLAAIEDRDFARRLREEKLDPLWEKALAGRDTPYYLHNWLWFDAALDVGVARRFDEFLSFLHPFDTQTFVETFPWAPFVACLLVFPVARAARGPRLRPIAVGLFLVPAIAICLHYLVWRGVHSLNFVEPLGPAISLALWGAELYCFVSVVFLVVQVGTRAPRPRQRPAVDGFAPSVDVMIPIFREPLDILERTLLAARSMDYPDFEVHVLDDGHREEVRALAERLGARYIEGPKRHAKAGNLNHALSRTTGDLVVVFDTDHVPVRTFLAETVPFFSEEAVGFVQTPHHFGNADIFQHGFRVSGRIPNEQDMFNHGIQSRRDGWGGSFFVGSGAVFRRKAIEGVGGFKLLSITEDIHTSQHLHAAGWTSVFVDRDLAVGLSAENLASYLVQRRRWMLGCLQIFFRDNPLFCRGLSLRHRVGYLASLYYFFFPLARVVFWSAPLAYLLFHLHPIFSDVAVLTALLIPYLVVLPMIPAVLIPDWPRPFWGSFYENAVSAPLARSMVDLLLPRSLGFAVTPKGLVTETSRFDWSSSRWTLLVAGITVFAIAKGLWEFWIFGIEKDAYFFNLAWAGYNLVFLAGAAMIAWERPQRRGENRVVCDLPARLEVADEERAIAGRVVDLSLSGCSVELDGARVLPRDLRVGIGSSGHAFEVAGRVVYQERMRGRVRVGVAFEGASEEVRRTILLGVMADPATWSDVHARETRSHVVSAIAFVLAVLRFPWPARARRRRHPRRGRLRAIRVVRDLREQSALVRNLSPLGAGLLWAGAPPRVGEPWWLIGLDEGPGLGRVVHVGRALPFVWRVGIEWIEAGEEDAGREVGIAA